MNYIWHKKFAWWWVETKDAGKVRWRFVYRMREYKAFDYLWRRPIYGWRYRVVPPL
jgi:hypothetical protein